MSARTKKKPYGIRVLDSDEVASPELIVFLDRLFPGLTLENWKWEYRASPGAAEVLISKSEYDILCHYSVIRIPFQRGGRVITGSKAEGSIIDLEAVNKLPPDPDRRVFQELVRASLKHAASVGVDLVFGFPSLQALHGQLKGGYRLVELPLVNARSILSMRRFAATRTGAKAVLAYLAAPFYDLLVGRRSGARAGANRDIREAAASDAEALERFADEITAARPTMIGIRRTWDYMQWRFGTNPYRDNTVLVSLDEDQAIDGVIAISVEPKGGSFVAEVQDVMARDAATTDALLKHALSWVGSRGGGALDVWTMDDQPHYADLNAVLRANGFWFRSSGPPKNMIVYSVDDETAYDVNNWYVSKSFQRF